jgi:chromosome segregation ATPase
VLRFEAEELDRTRDELTRALEERRKSQIVALQPTFDRLTQNLADLQREITQQREYRAKELDNQQNMRAKLDDGSRRADALEAQKLKQRQQLNKIKMDPTRMRQQVAQVEKVLTGLQTENANMLIETTSTETLISEVSTKRRECESRRAEVQHKQEMLRSLQQKREARADDVRRLVAEENERTSTLTEQRAQLEMEHKQAKRELRGQNESAQAYMKLLDEQKKRFELLRRKSDGFAVMIPPLQETNEEYARALREYQAEERQHRKSLAELKQDVDVAISSFLKTEKLDEDRAAELEEIERRYADVEESIKRAAHEERTLQQQLSSLISQRQRMSRAARKAELSVKDANAEVRVQDVVCTDLGKSLAALQARLNDCSQMYEVVKTQRNKYAHLTQASAQALAEMKEKIKILSNEVEILRTESLAKDRSAAEEDRLLHAAQYTREALRTELARCNRVLNDHKQSSQQQLMEVDKLNSLVNGSEREMIRLRQAYADAVEHRNMTGIQLIDRNDELCILHEKYNIQAGILERGNVELERRENEIKTLTVEIIEAQRKLDVARKTIPNVQDYTDAAKKIAALESDLSAERKRKDELCAVLEAPTEETIQARVRDVGGDVPDEDQLAAKIEVLQERLNEKREQLLERHLVLDEVTHLSDTLRTKAAEGRSATLDLAQAINDFQSKIRAITQKMMATVSELSMYQATSMKLEQERAEKEHTLSEAKRRFEQQGEAPTDEAEHEWLQLERDRQRKHETLRRMQATKGDPRLDPATAAMMTRTTAEPRPNAYIPDDLGIPKPYGGAAPFKPSVLGANLRHIRKPEPKPIEI